MRWSKTKENTDFENARERFPRESRGNKGCAVYHKGLGWLPSVEYLHVKHLFPDVASGAFLGQWSVLWYRRSSIWIGPRDHLYKYPGVYLDSINSWLLQSIMSNGGPICMIVYQLDCWKCHIIIFIHVICLRMCLVVCEWLCDYWFSKMFRKPTILCFMHFELYIIFCAYPSVFIMLHARMFVT